MIAGVPLVTVGLTLFVAAAVAGCVWLEVARPPVYSDRRRRQLQRFCDEHAVDREGA